MFKIPISLFFVFLTVNCWSHGIAQGDHHALLEGGHLAYLRLGTLHMLTGFDHLLFLFGVIFFLKGLKDVLKYISVFTLGHSITLVFATWLEITANEYLVDAIIALSVCYKGFENLNGFHRLLKIQPPPIVGAIFLFGLIHGFGLSTRLQQLPLGHEGLILRILSFNAGIEIGQIMALGILVLLMTLLKKAPSFQTWGRIANLILITIGGLLFLMQMHSFAHTQFPHTFGFDEEKHFKLHQDMEIIE